MPIDPIADPFIKDAESDADADADTDDAAGAPAGPALPAYFVSHGAPTLPIDEAAPARAFLESLGRRIVADHGTPRAILVASAHWEADRPTLTGAERPETIHDFHGFPDKLYELSYPAPGAPGLAETVAARLAGAGLPATIDPRRGLDHGAWVPLLLMRPAADIPVVQLSIQTGLGPAHHLALGRALRPLREEGVLVLGSGGATHNLREMRGSGETPDWVTRFSEGLAERIAEGDPDAVSAWADTADGRRNHPSAEHFLPLFVAMGAGGSGMPGERLHHSLSHRILAMDSYRFD